MLFGSSDRSSRREIGARTDEFEQACQTPVYIGAAAASICIVRLTKLSARDLASARTRSRSSYTQLREHGVEVVHVRIVERPFLVAGVDLIGACA